MPEAIKFLGESGALGVFTLSCIVALGVLWKHLVAREKRHDEDRNQWLSSLLEVAHSNAANQEKIANSLNMLEEGQKRLYDLYHEVSHASKN